MTLIESVELPSDVEAAVERMLELPAAQRQAISDWLRDSVPPSIDEATLESWRHRVQEIKTGAVKGIPAEQFFAALGEDLDAAR